MMPDEKRVTKRLGPVRRLYRWVIGWAETRFGLPALAAVSFAESSVFPVPPDPLLMALCLGATRRSLIFAAVATGASVVGGAVGYWIGAEAWHAVGSLFIERVPGVTEESFERVRMLYDRWDFGAVVMAAVTPIPYKVFTIAAGVFSIDFWTFALGSLIGRGLRFFVVAGLIFRFGDPITAFIERYFTALAWALGILMLAGFWAVRVLA